MSGGKSWTPTQEVALDAALRDALSAELCFAETYEHVALETGRGVNSVKKKVQGLFGTLALPKLRGIFEERSPTTGKSATIDAQRKKLLAVNKALLDAGVKTVDPVEAIRELAARSDNSAAVEELAQIKGILPATYEETTSARIESLLETLGWYEEVANKRADEIGELRDSETALANRLEHLEGQLVASRGREKTLASLAEGAKAEAAKAIAALREATKRPDNGEVAGALGRLCIETEVLAHALNESPDGFAQGIGVALSSASERAWRAA